MIWFGMTVGMFVGGTIPMLWGSSELSFSAVILSTIGGLVGIWFGLKMSH